jgi:hypothetical protein
MMLIERYPCPITSSPLTPFTLKPLTSLANKEHRKMRLENESAQSKMFAMVEVLSEQNRSLGASLFVPY